MSARVKLRHSLSDNWRDFLLVLATVCGVLAVILPLKGWRGAEPAALGLVLSLVLLGLELLARFRNRRSVTVMPDGFILHDRRGEHIIADDQVLCLSLRRIPNYASDVLLGWTRVFHVWVDQEGATELIRMINEVSASEGDPLQLLIERLHQRMLDQARQDLAAGGAFSGEGWSLTADEFIVSTGRETRRVPLRELAPVTVIDHAVCVWRRGEDEPIARISLDTANAAIAVDLLKERIDDADDPAPISEPDGDELGRLLFERRPLQTRENLARIGGTALFLLGVIAGLAVRGAVTLEQAIAGGAVLAVVGLIWIAVLARCVVLRCYEYGVWSRRFFREEWMRHTEIETFRYSCLRRYVNGVYTDTRLVLEFVPQASSGKRKIRYRMAFKHGDTELDGLRERVSGVIAARMLQELGAGQPVRWTQQARFLPEGIEVRARRRWSWRREPILVPYGELAGTNLEDGQLYVWRRGQSRPFLAERSDVPNFFPGYALLMSCFRWPQTAPEPKAEALAV